jgi:protein-tyrosine-phosphatase
MAETLLRHLSKGAVNVVSAGSDPKPEINPGAREAVRRLLGLEMTGQEPKSMNPFVREHFDFVITVCDHAAEVCPAFPGAEIIEWSLPDPAAVGGTEDEKNRAFDNSARDLMQRIRLWLSQNPTLSGGGSVTRIGSTPGSTFRPPPA